MLEEKATLLDEAKESQVIGSKCKEIAAGDKKGQQLSKKARGKQLGKYCRGAAVKIGGFNLYERSEKRKAEMTWRGSRMALEKVRRRGTPLFASC